jgi:SAM-dependent methyltransferase
VTTLRTQSLPRAILARAARRALAFLEGDRPQAGRVASSTAAEVDLQSEAPAPELPGTAEPKPVATGALATDEFARKLAPGYLAVEHGGLTRLLYSRLSEQDVAETEQLIRDTPGAWEHYAAAGADAARQQILLALGMWLEGERVIEKTGLVKAEPPEEVHTMTRGALAAAGGLYEGDLLIDALAGVGVEMRDLARALDFGCSSGRVLRALKAGYPAVEWHGCDPNAPAIAWASENLPRVDFFVSGDEPPLPLGEASLDLVYAISIWSHFAPQLGLRWFEEMHRVIRPGGYLLCTTHGLTSVAHYALGGMRSPEQSREIADDLYRQGWWYAAEFGAEGDWGVVNPDWGTAFLSPEWMLAQLCPRWRVLEFAAGRNQDNQDVYLLQRA